MRRFRCAELLETRSNLLENSENPRKKRPKSWLIFSTLAFQMAIIMWACVRAGHWLDTQYPSAVNWTLWMSIGGVVLVIWRIIQTTKRL
ncbi:MAG: AtpZ/AtpI family protein [Flavobacteriaceae bacterium]